MAASSLFRKVIRLNQRLRFNAPALPVLSPQALALVLVSDLSWVLFYQRKDAAANVPAFSLLCSALLLAAENGEADALALALVQEMSPRLCELVQEEVRFRSR